jgi:hypothetical protein
MASRSSNTAQASAVAGTATGAQTAPVRFNGVQLIDLNKRAGLALSIADIQQAEQRRYPNWTGQQ